MKYNYVIDISSENAHSLVLREIIPGSRVLEFGPATGYMTKYMTERLGCKVFCVEMDKEAAMVASSYCEKMIIEDIEDFGWVEELKGECFNYIIFTDILEHLKDPRKVLKLSKSFLKKDGSILCSIPNIGHNAVIMDLIQGKFDYRPLGLLDESHLRFYTKKSVIELLESSGLTIIKLQAIFVRPEDTELRQDYTSFPKPVEDILKSREEANVYQFITVSKKNEDIRPEDKPLLQLPTATPWVDDYLQIFWHGSSGFSEENSIKLPLQYDKGFCIYETPLPALAAGPFRLDIGSMPAYAEIRNVEVFQGPPESGKNPFFVTSEDNGFSGLIPYYDVVCLNCSDSYKFVCTNEDPQIILNLPETISEAELPVYIRVGMNVQKRISESDLRTFATKISELKSELLEKEQVLENQREELSHKAQLLAEQKEEISNLKASLARVKLERIVVEENLEQIVQSFSWKITAPARKAADFFIRVINTK